MPLVQPEHPELFSRFERWYRQNQIGGWSCRWRRRRIWWAQAAQKVGVQISASAPMFWGESMHVITNEEVSRGLLAFGYAEPTITALMLILLKKGANMVDVGAHFGYEALLGARLIGPSGHVVSFEPNPAVFQILSHNLVGRAHVRLACAAASDLNGAALFQDRPIAESAFSALRWDASEDATTYEVDVLRLDDALKEHERPVTFLKCDAEGHEIAVLGGATSILTADRPFLVLEAEMPTPQGEISPKTRELVSYLRRHEYEAYSFDYDGAWRFATFDAFPVSHANIAFLPKERTDLLRRLLH